MKVLSKAASVTTTALVSSTQHHSVPWDIIRDGNLDPSSFGDMRQETTLEAPPRHRPCQCRKGEKPVPNALCLEISHI